VHLPAGVISILLSLVPMFALPIALGMGIDRVSAGRLLGLACGLGGVVLIVGPETSLPDPAMAVFIPLALIAPFFYALEGNIVGKWGTLGLDPIQLLFGASAVGLLFALPLAVGTGHFIDPRVTWGAPEAAIVAVLARPRAGLFGLRLDGGPGRGRLRRAGELPRDSLRRDVGDGAAGRDLLVLGLGRDGADVRGALPRPAAAEGAHCGAAPDRTECGLTFARPPPPC
jgi:hypothetical protein